LSTRLALTTLLLFLASAAPSLAAPPPNDNFADALALSGESGGVDGTNVDATKETGEPDHADNPGGHSIWYRWTAPRAGLATFDTCTGTDFDTLLAVYTGASVGTLTEVASNDDGIDCSPESGIVFPVDAGTVYRIAADGFDGDQGVVGLSWHLEDLPPANATRPVLSGVAMEDEVLSVTSGGWQRATSFAYSWQRCSPTGATTNVARGKPVGASQEEPLHLASHAVDGNFFSYWGSGAFPPQWIEVDLGGSFPIGKVRAAVTMLPGGLTTHIVYGRVAGRGYEYALVGAHTGITADQDWLEFPGPAAVELESILVESTESPSWIGWREIEALSPCTEIAGATGSSYRLTTRDIGSTVRAVVTATNAAGSTSAASASTATVTTHSPVNTEKPLVTGEPQVGLMLSVAPGVWSGKQPISYGFQWQSCDALLSSCANIAGAIQPAYFPLEFDVGSRLRAVVTATNSGGATSAVSEPTDPVRSRPVQRRCIVPRLKGKTVRQARSTLQRSHCRLGVVRHVHSAKVRRGRVLAQRPAAGNRLREGARVNVTVSSGARR
jgi:hypothetical protein